MTHGRNGDCVLTSGPASHRRTAGRDPPWVMRTYSGHSTAKASNELYRTNLAKGQTGLSIAFDLPDPDRLRPRRPRGRRRGRQGRRPRRPPRPHGPAAGRHPGRADEHVDDHQRHRRLAARPLHRQRRGPRRRPAGAAGHHPERHRQGVPVAGAPTSSRPRPSRRLTVDTIAYTVRHVPKWNPINVCSYHLQEAGATPVQEVAYALATAIGVLDAVRDSGQVDPSGVPLGRRPDLVLRQRRDPLRRGDLQDAGLHRAVGPDLPRALRRRPTPSCAASATACRSTRSA